ncbi:MAG: membrane dipeptidase [Clostridia bacterium]|nr:membrane dipeptidase [Clostridia bacterium]
MISLFDLHCDTLLKAYLGSYSLWSSPLHISLDKAADFSTYNQVMAIWTDDRLNDHDGYLQYLNIVEYAKNQKVLFANNFSNLSNSTFILAIEDARIIEDDLSRVDQFFSDGVRIITPVWKGINSIGGAWDTSVGLTEFGKNAICRMLELGILVDISHASVESAYDIMNICALFGAPPIASHSNCLSVCNHKRNLSSKQFYELASLGGIVGICLCPEHLSSSGYATIDDILNHIDAFLCLGWENKICLGCDFDGVSSLPLKISGISDLKKLYFRIESTYDEKIANKIFFDNAFSFFKNLV